MRCAARDPKRRARSAIPTVILERAIADPRHIEIQVFGDRHGNAIHLGERDCSVQRRHQKLIEEAPSPAVSAELRARMGAVAVAAVKSIGYEGAGTLEFLLDASGEFYFMEMNTRLQVEHPVTEAITGLDLVELQLRVAGGEPLGLKQEDIKFSGHAIEVRLCSEDAGHDFMPQSGRMALWQMPGDIRVEHALQSGSDIPPFYDSMIAKLISHGESREAGAEQADLRSRTDRGVRRHHQSGISRSIACAHPAFARGEATTAFIGKHRDDLLATRADAACRGGAGGVAALCQRSLCAAVAQRTDAGGDVSDSRSRRTRSRQSMSSKSCASAMAAISPASTAASTGSRSMNSTATPFASAAMA